MFKSKKYFLVFGLGLTVHALSSANSALYDTVGQTYDETRCADPEITDLLIQHLNTKDCGSYIDICCGSGNYTNAIHAKGITICGVDISEVMLEKARIKNKSINWLNGDVLNLPFLDESFDGALCISAIHHFNDLEMAIKEFHRILKPGSRLVIFSSTKAQAKESWLNYYFPFIWEKGKDVLPDENEILNKLNENGFTKSKIEIFFVKESTKDLYLHTGKYKPEIYLNQLVRDGMTPFNMPIFAEETKKGLIRLEEDIKNGKVKDIIERYEKNIGENIFIIAEKNSL